MLTRLLAVGACLLMVGGCADTAAEEQPVPSPSSAPQPTATPQVTATLQPTTASQSTTPLQPTRASQGRELWVPKQRTTWQWQLQGTLDLTVDVPVYDVDGQTTTADQVAELHRQGRHVICYVSVGSHESLRPDQAAFPQSVLGKPLDGWPNERWLDIRQWDKLAPILAARFDQCRKKGFDAVEPDNVDGYANSSGFPLTAEDQLTFNRRIAALAHDRGLSVGLKNDVDQAAALEPAFDFAVNEECMRYDECEGLRTFLRAGKAVLHVEYDLEPAVFCAKAQAMGLSSMHKPLDLGPDRHAC